MGLNTYQPDYDIEFYKEQNSMMEERYRAIFKKRGISWSNYLKNAESKLKHNIYYIWIFLCGLDTFLKHNNNLNYKDKSNLIKSLYKDANERIYRIIGDDQKNEDYIKSL